jgi:hypothetical protein
VEMAGDGAAGYIFAAWCSRQRGRGGVRQ